jgi:mono/diheme cytochrome c family protein
VNPLVWTGLVRYIGNRTAKILLVACLVVSAGMTAGSQLPAQRETGALTFYKDVLPILIAHCQSCHRAGGIGPMPLVSFSDARPWAKAIREQVIRRTMPPWFAEPGIGHFANDPFLTNAEIQTISLWVSSGAREGDAKDAPTTSNLKAEWNIEKPDAVIRMSRPVPIPSRGEVEYVYQIIPTGFTEDRWVSMAEIRPSSPAHVHHAVVYVRPPSSKWLRGGPVGRPFTASDLSSEQDRRDAMWTDSDVLLVYAPGSSPDQWPPEMAKLIPAKSDLVFQMHYTTNGRSSEDATEIGLVFAHEKPAKRVLTLQLTNDRFVIPPGVDNYRVEVHGTIPNDCLLLSFFPHMHLRGKRFEYNILSIDGRVEPLLVVNYDFYWQLSYRLAQPRVLRSGTELQAVAWFDNSKNNPHNPDPDAAVRWGDQTDEEMMVGFFDVAVASGVDKWSFFRRAAR